MSRRLRTMLALILALALLASGLSLAALSEEAPTEDAQAQTTLPADAPAEGEAVAESEGEALAEEPAAEATEAPAAEPTAEATEAPAEEYGESPADAESDAPATDENSELPAEEGKDAEASGALSDAQKEALENLPEGFSSEAVALTMLRSSGCKHTELYVDEDYASSVVTPLNEDYHTITYQVKKRILTCMFCEEVLQTVAVNKTYSVSRTHEWEITKIGTKITLECSECGTTKKVARPCSHNIDYLWMENGWISCDKCGKGIGTMTIENDCKHKHYTICGTEDKPEIYYQDFSEEQHVKYSQIYIADDGNKAYCDDCGSELYIENGRIVYDGIIEWDAGDFERTGMLEAHTFENGVCKYCGEKEAAKVCDHSAGNYRDELDTSVAPKYSSITETTHCVQYSYKRYCTDCNTYIKNVVDEGITPVAHDFSAGDTCACGYQKQANKPYVVGFSMSESSITVGDTVRFMLNLANAEDGETLELDFLADGQFIKSFSLTAPQDSFEHTFSKAGNRKLQFRVKGGECCAAQTLIVESDAPEVESVSLSLGTGKNFKLTETAEGAAITATITCNRKTGLAELYVGDVYGSSESYTEENGQRVFTIEVRLGGSGTCYAGEYKIRANALKQRYVDADMDANSIGTLTVEHDYSVIDSQSERYYEKNASGHTLCEKTTVKKQCTVCGKEATEDSTKQIGSLTAHSYDADGKCSVCGYKNNIKFPADDNRMSDVYKTSIYYQNLKNVELSGNYADDIVAVARSQIGYRESIDFTGTGTYLDNHTEYNNFYGLEDVSWCANFVCWCAGRTGTTAIKLESLAVPFGLCPDAKEIALFLSAEEIGKVSPEKYKDYLDNDNVKYYVTDRSQYIPQAGDLIFFHKADKSYMWAHVGIVTGCSGNYVYFIDGNNNGNGKPADDTTNITGMVYERKVDYTNPKSNVIGFARPNY